MLGETDPALSHMYIKGGLTQILSIHRNLVSEQRMKNHNQHVSIPSARADAIFFEALGFEDENQRSAFVTNACSGSTSLRDEVDALFVSLSNVGDFLEDDAALQISAKDLYEVLSELTGDDKSG